MKPSNKLFIASTIVVPLILISINYSEIVNSYNYLGYLNNMKILPGAYQSDPDRFQNTKQMQDSTCFTTPNDNLFCYQKPRMYEEHGISYVIGENGIDGEICGLCKYPDDDSQRLSW